MGGIVQLVLHDFEKTQAGFAFWVVIDGGGVQIQHLPVHDFFTRANVANAIEQLFPVIASAQVFQALVVERKTFFQVFLEHR